MSALIRTFVFEKETKNTYRFQETPGPTEDPIINVLYVQKSAFGTRSEGPQAPKELRVSVEVVK